MYYVFGIKILPNLQANYPRLTSTETPYRALLLGLIILYIISYCLMVRQVIQN